MSYIIVTGAAGFIGSNIVKALNARGERNIIAVDNLKNGDKFVNLVDCEIVDYMDKEEFLAGILCGSDFSKVVRAILHQGACSDTTERDGRYMMENNYEYTKRLWMFCTSLHVPFIYASSAAVYGAHTTFKEEPAFEAPLNVYGYSKLLFDQYARRNAQGSTAQVVGLRYFNVYGEREQHKGRMASVAMHFFNQYRANGKVKLFEGNAGYGNGEQQRDFVSVEDIVKINLFFLDHPEKSGIFNAGTGKAQTFNDVAVATINALRKAEDKPALSLAQMQAQGLIEYIPFPGDLRGRYQSYTQADISALREAEYDARFLTVEQGVARYIEKLIAKAQ